MTGAKQGGDRQDDLLLFSYTMRSDFLQGLERHAWSTSFLLVCYSRRAAQVHGKRTTLERRRHCAITGGKTQALGPHGEACGPMRRISRTLDAVAGVEVS